MTDIEKKDIDLEASTPIKEDKKGVDAFSEDDIPEDATWGEVVQSCCCHSPSEWGMIAIGVSTVIFFLYFFLFGLDLLGAGAKVMGGCAAGELFGDDTNPVAGVMIGILATVFLQSSSTTTSIVVSLVGAGSVSVNQGIYMIMGANIGTSGKSRRIISNVVYMHIYAVPYSIIPPLQCTNNIFLCFLRQQQ
ncbi:MAG: hypothetical protein ACI8RD_011865 [Bacillariaceae sp.]|jgi:hypothetical protein